MAKEVTYASPLEARAAASKSRTIDRADDGPTRPQISQRQTRITSGDISDVMMRARGTWERVKADRAATETMLRSSAELVTQPFSGSSQSEGAEEDRPVDEDNLISRFWDLQSSQRHEIAQALGLLEQGDLQIPETPRYTRVFARAGKRRIIPELAAAVARMENS